MFYAKIVIFFDRNSQYNFLYYIKLCKLLLQHFIKKILIGSFKISNFFWPRTGVFIINFEHISHLFLVFLLLTLSTYMPAGKVELAQQRQIVREPDSRTSTGNQTLLPRLETQQSAYYGTAAFTLRALRALQLYSKAKTPGQVCALSLLFN